MTARLWTASTIKGVAFGKIVAVAGDEPNLVDLSLRDDAEPVVLNLMQPTGPARRRFGRSGKARLETGEALNAALQFDERGHAFRDNARALTSRIVAGSPSPVED